MGTDTMRRGGARRGAGFRIWMTGDIPLSTPPATPRTGQQPVRLRGARPPYAFASDDPRLATLRRDAAARLRPVCADMADDSFDALVGKVAAFRLRWAPR